MHILQGDRIIAYWFQPLLTALSILSLFIAIPRAGRIGPQAIQKYFMHV